MKLLLSIAALLLLLATFATAANSTGSSRQAKAFRMADSRSSSPSSSSSSSSGSEKPIASNEISQFLNTKNIVKTIVKLVFGTSEESVATSRQVLNLLVKVLDMLKTSFTQRNARSSSGGNRGLKDTADDAAVAGISMLKGFVRSALTAESACMQRHICDAAAAASRESRELGYLIAQVGGYASSYVLDGQKGATPNASYEAARIGRSGADCKAVYSSCIEKQEL